MNDLKFNLFRGVSILLMGIALAFGVLKPSYAANLCVSSVAELQIALSDAQSNGQDDTVQIVQGTYVGNFVYSGLEANNLTVEGGYTANCASRTVAAANTLLDGQQAGTTLVLISDKKIDFLIEGVTLQNGKSVSAIGGGGLYMKTPEGNVTVSHSAIARNIAEKSGGGIRVISTDTATFTNNTINGNTSGSPGGGGISVESGTTIFTNNTITGNTASRSNGGGVYAKSSATFTNNTMTENSAGWQGGAAYVEGTATFTSNTIKNNTANSKGGGISVTASSRTVVFTDNTITDNTAQSNGGGVSVNAGTVTFTNNTISNNKVLGNYNGGGIYVSSSTATFTGNTVSSNTTGQSGGGIYVSSRTITFVKNTINNNTANGNNRATYGGGGIYTFISSSSGKASFTDNTIKGNVAESNGGGIHAKNGTATFTNNAILGNTANQNGAGIYTTSTSVSTFTNNLISGNTAKTESGGGLHVTSDTANLINNTITGNSANLGGGIWLELKDNADIANIYNNIVWSNNAAQGGDIYLVNDGNGDFQRSVVELYNNDFDKTANNGIYLKIAFAIDASNLNNVNPLFADASNGDYHLQETSPCIDKGNNLAPERPNTDKDNRPRISNGTVDIGAYEYPSADSEGVLQFAQATYTVDEETGSALMTVTRTSGSVGAVSVAYETADGTAKAGDDYTAASGTLNWGDGETAPKTFTITIANDGVKEEDETINLTLKNATGDATIGLQETAVLTISASKQYQLTLSQSGTGTGRVTGEGIDCGSDCTEIYEANTQVTLTAAPETGSIFVGWTGACSGAETTCQVTIDKVQTVTATFNLVPTHGLTINKVGTGSGKVTGEGIDCGIDCTEEYADSSKVVTLTATPDSGSVFAGWGGACTGTTATCQVTVNKAQNVTATFNSTPMALTVSTTGNGSVIGDGIHCGSDCTETYSHNTTVTLTAQPGTGSTFIGWGDHCSGTEMTCQVVMDQARTVTAQFESYYSVTVIKDGTGEGSVTDGDVLDCGEQCDTSYEEGSPVTLVATPAEGSVFVSWNGACVGTEPTCAFTMTQNQIVMATFNNQLAEERDACFTFSYHQTTPFSVEVDASCSGEGISLYQWETADGQTADGQTSEFSFEALTDKYAVITLRVTDDLNAIGTSSQILTFDESIVFTGAKPFYKVGDLLTIEVVENLPFSQREERVDLWVAVQLPTGELLFFTPVPLVLSFDPQPFKLSVGTAETNHQVLELVIPPDLGGSYTLYALYVQAGKNPLTDTLSRITRSNLAATKMIFSNH